MQPCGAECKQRATHRTIRHVSMENTDFSDTELPSLQVCMERYRFPDIMRQYFSRVSLSSKPIEFVVNKHTGRASKARVYMFEFVACKSCLTSSAAVYFEDESLTGWRKV
jgi:hypothetical protein